jgi:spore maturation protein CgeB
MKRAPVMVFAGEFWAGSSGCGLAEGFRQAGWAVREVDLKHYRIPPVGGRALSIVSRLAHRMTREAYLRKVLEECRTLKPDIFLTIKGMGMTAELLRRIKETGARTVMYYPDYHFDYAGVSIDSFGEYDLFVTTKTFQRQYLEGLIGGERVAYVPHGYVPAVHRPIFDEVAEDGFRVDVLYPGNHSAYKQKWLESTLAGMQDLSVEIVGNRWRENVSSGPLAHCIMTGERIGVGYVAAIQTARINVAIHHGPAASGWEDLVSTRTFEIPACKGFMLHIDNSEVRELYTPGVEIDVFSDPEELADKMRFYLARPELRAEMINRAYKRSVPAYSYSSRVAAIDSLIAERVLINSRRAASI